MSALEGQAVNRPHKYFFFGRIHPERYDWGIDKPFEVIVTHHDGASSHVCITIAHSQVSVTTYTNCSEPVLNMKNRVTRLVRNLADAIGFVVGASLDVEIISCIAPDGNSHVFNTAFDGLTKYSVGSKESMTAFNALINQATRSQFVRMALSDLRNAIREPLDTCANCYRAVESIRQEYLEGNSNKARPRKDSWQRLREAVGLNEAEVRWLEERAIPRRHGEPIDVNHADRERALQLAWRVVEQHCLNYAEPSGSKEI